MNRGLIFSLLLGGLFVLPTLASAQSFIAPLEQLSQKETIAILPDGTEIKGQVKMYMLMNGSLRSLTIKSEDGEKHKLKAADVKEVKNKVSDLQRFMAMADATSSITSLVKTDFNEIAKREYAQYQQALLPKKKGKYALLQLLNPGFDKGIQVYLDPNANETTGVMGIGGGDDKSYIVVRDGTSMLIKKAQYKKQFPELFAGCQPLMDSEDIKKPKFKHFASHVWAFDQLCME